MNSGACRVAARSGWTRLNESLSLVRASRVVQLLSPPRLWRERRATPKGSGRGAEATALGRPFGQTKVTIWLSRIPLPMPGAGRHEHRSLRRWENARGRDPPRRRCVSVQNTDNRCPHVLELGLGYTELEGSPVAHEGHQADARHGVQHVALRPALYHLFPIGLAPWQHGRGYSYMVCLGPLWWLCAQRDYKDGACSMEERLPLDHEDWADLRHLRRNEISKVALVDFTSAYLVMWSDRWRIAHSRRGYAHSDGSRVRSASA